MSARAFAFVLAVASAHCGGLEAGSAFPEATDASADVTAIDAETPLSVGRACGTDSDCADLTAADGQYLCGYRVDKPSPANCTSQAKTCIFVSSLGRGAYFGPECGCDGGSIDIDPTWPAARAPVTSLGPCTAPASDAAIE